MTKIAHAWIRELRPDGSRHRIGCMAAQKVSSSKARIAFSLCAPSDKMDVKKAKQLAMRRLKEFKTKSTIIDIDDMGTLGFEHVLNIASTIKKHLNAGRMYDLKGADYALHGLLSEVCPQK